MDLSLSSVNIRSTTKEAVKNKPIIGELRVWTVLHSVFTAATMTFLAGSVNGFTSPALLELTQHEDEDYKFDTTLSDVFGVSSI